MSSYFTLGAKAYFGDVDSQTPLYDVIPGEWKLEHYPNRVEMFSTQERKEKGKTTYDRVEGSHNNIFTLVDKKHQDTIEEEDETAFYFYIVEGTNTTYKNLEGKGFGFDFRGAEDYILTRTADASGKVFKVSIIMVDPPFLVESSRDVVKDINDESDAELDLIELESTAIVGPSSNLSAVKVEKGSWQLEYEPGKIVVKHLGSHGGHIMTETLEGGPGELSFIISSLNSFVKKTENGEAYRIEEWSGDYPKTFVNLYGSGFGFNLGRSELLFIKYVGEGGLCYKFEIIPNDQPSELQEEDEIEGLAEEDEEETP